MATVSMNTSKRPKAIPQREAKAARTGAQRSAIKEQTYDADLAPVVMLAGRTQDPGGVGPELAKLVGSSAVAVKRGIRKTDEVPARYAIPDAVNMMKGCGNPSQELIRLQERYPEVFAKERERVREH